MLALQINLHGTPYYHTIYPKDDNSSKGNWRDISHFNPISSQKSYLSAH